MMFDDGRDLLGGASWDERLAQIEERNAQFRAAEERADRVASVVGIVLALACVLFIVLMGG